LDDRVALPFLEAQRKDGSTSTKACCFQARQRLSFHSASSAKEKACPRSGVMVCRQGKIALALASRY
jgi:hypothetical protein